MAQKLTASYTIALANPPLANFPFDLAFFRRGVTPAPPAVKVMEALRAIGYTGPEVINLAQVSMYITKITLPSLPAFIGCTWSGTQALAVNTWTAFPMSSVSEKETDEIKFNNPAIGEFYVTRSGLYQCTGSVTVNENNGFLKIGAQMNYLNPDNVHVFRYPGNLDSQPSLPFSFTGLITPTNIAQGVDGRAATIRIVLFAGGVAQSLANVAGVNWLTIARVG